jgi:hypothetical protein
MSGANAALAGDEYNYLFHNQAVAKIQAQDALARCQSSGNCDVAQLNSLQDAINYYNNLDTVTNALAEQICAGGASPACSQAIAIIQAAASSYNDPVAFGILRDYQSAATSEAIAITPPAPVTVGSVLRSILDTCSTLCDPGAQMSIGDAPGAEALKFLESIGEDTAAAQTGVGAASTLAANNAAGKAAEAEVAADFQAQGGFQFQSQVTLSNGSVSARTDFALDGMPNATVQVPPGYIAEDLGGNVLVDAQGNPITSFNLNSQGQAIIEVKTGGGDLTSNQAAVYPTVQSGTAAPVGGNAAKVYGSPLPSNLPPTPVIVLRKQ